MRMLRCPPRPKGCWEIHARYKCSNNMKLVAKKMKEYCAVYYMRDDSPNLVNRYTLFVKVK